MWITKTISDAIAARRTDRAFAARLARTLAAERDVLDRLA